jgi:hypothetical protein
MGKRNPLTLVASVVARNSSVQAFIGFAVSSPIKTTSPDKIPIRLKSTCTAVKAVIPKTMIFSPSEFRPILRRPVLAR